MRPIGAAAVGMAEFYAKSVSRHLLQTPPTYAAPASGATAAAAASAAATGAASAAAAASVAVGASQPFYLDPLYVCSCIRLGTGQGMSVQVKKSG